VKTFITRAVVLVGLLLFGWVLDHFLEPLGLRWVVWTLAGVVVAFFLLETGLRARKRARERADWRRWRAAMDDPNARRAAIRELRSRIDATRRLGRRFRVRHARLATTLAELHEADGDGEAAVKVLAKVPATELEPLQEAVVRHARAQAYLHAGDPEGAAATLKPLPESTGDAVLDASLTLVRGAVALEESRVDDALSAAREIAAKAEPHDELWDEATALEAACLHEQGDEDAAREALARLEEAGRRRLARVGSARVRDLIGTPAARA
jgi:hypothetical protein